MRHCYLLKLLVVVFAVVVGAAASGQTLPCETQKLTASDADLLDLFGNSVAVSGDHAIIGAWNDDGPFAFAWGSAYIFERIDGVWVEQQKLTPSDADEQDRFGHVVAISGDVAVVGSPMNDDACPGDVFCDSGSAYVFRKIKGEWTEEQKLTAGDAVATDQYGITLAISGDVIVIGAPWQDEACGGGFSCNAGAAYVYRFDGDQWGFEEKLMASDADVIDELGLTVSISGDTILVGARGDNDDGFNSGAAYIYQYNGVDWDESQKLTASDAQEGDEFGWGVSISGEVALIGAGLVDTACPEDILCNSGSAYVFRFDGAKWIEEQKLEAPDMAKGDQVGRSVAIDGDAAVLGSRWNDDLCPENPDCNSGAAYLFRFDGRSWALQQKLTPHDAEPVDLFGSTVAVNGTTVFVGSEGDDDDGTASGSAYCYTLDGIDSDGDGVADECDICPGGDDTLDDNGNGIPDDCEDVLGDLDGDGVVGTSDLILLLGAWGDCDDCEDCIADLDGDCVVGTGDLIILLGSWG